MNPYEVLGISRSASDREVEQAYQNIIETYGANNHSDNPLSHLAEEKISKATEAYHLIKKQRQNQYGEPSEFMDIRRLINNNMISEADELLEGVPVNRRDAEWYFLKGSVQHSRGWLEDAYENFIRATQLNPQNAEYRAALNQLQWQRQTGQPAGGYKSQSQIPAVQCGVCNICASMCFANMCCNCMTGC